MVDDVLVTMIRKYAVALVDGNTDNELAACLTLLNQACLSAYRYLLFGLQIIWASIVTARSFL
jgi:hypothetical protein